jgi:hypothetical protein
VKDNLLKMIEDGYKRIDLAIESTLRTEAREVAKEMLQKSKYFWNEFCTWINRNYNHTLTRSAASPAEVWSLMTRCIRLVFAELRTARLPGCQSTESSMMWGALHAHAIAKEFIDLNFEGHSKVAVILQQHVIDNTTPLSKYYELHAMVTKNQQDVTKIRVAADSALSLAKKK